MTATPPKFTEDICKYVAEQAISEGAASLKGMEEKGVSSSGVD
jgi:hypothetical protein